MWTTEQSIETTASPESIWRLWSHVATWGEWNADIERIEISRPFARGSTIAMTPAPQETVELRIAKTAEPLLFVDEAELGEITVTTFHRLDTVADARSRVIYRMEITGLAADTLGPVVGLGSSGDFPDVLAAPVEQAGRWIPILIPLVSLACGARRRSWPRSPSASSARSTRGFPDRRICRR